MRWAKPRSQLGAKLLVVDHPPQGQKQFPVAAVAQSPTTQHARFLEGPPSSCTTTGVPTANDSRTT